MRSFGSAVSSAAQRSATPSSFALCPLRTSSLLTRKFQSTNSSTSSSRSCGTPPTKSWVLSTFPSWANANSDSGLRASLRSERDSETRLEPRGLPGSSSSSWQRPPQ